MLTHVVHTTKVVLRYLIKIIEETRLNCGNKMRGVCTIQGLKNYSLYRQCPIFPLCIYPFKLFLLDEQNKVGSIMEVRNLFDFLCTRAALRQLGTS